MKISVFATSIRPHHWLSFCENIAQATTHPFQIIFSGPHVKPDGLPDNFRYIKTTVKPAQAMEIARLACVTFTDGDLMVQAVDDVRFTPLALDRMAEACKTPKTIATCEYWANGGDHRIAMTEGIFGSCGEFPRVADNAPLQPVCPMMLTKDWPDMDPCFCAQYGELDGFLRKIVDGWTVKMVDAKVHENSAGSDLWRSKGQGDLTTIRRLWRNPETGNFDPARRGTPGKYNTELNMLNQDQGITF